MEHRQKRSQKQSSDYPQMIFRIDQKDKDELQTQINRLVWVANRDAEKKGLKKLRKNDIIVSSLFLGLKVFENKLIANKKWKGGR